MLPPSPRGRVGLACVVRSGFHLAVPVAGAAAAVVVAGAVGVALAVAVVVAVAVAVGVALAVAETVAVGVVAAPPSSIGSGVGVGGGGFSACCRHAPSSSGEIIAAPMTTERTTSLMGDRPCIEPS